MSPTKPNQFYFYNDLLKDDALNRHFNEEASILEVPLTSSLFLPYLANARMIGICNSKGGDMLKSTHPDTNFTMFERVNIAAEDMITPVQLATLSHAALWGKAREILSGLKMVSFVEEEQAESGKPEYNEEKYQKNSIFSISEDVLKQVGDDDLHLFISYNDEDYSPFGVAAYFIYLPLVWHPTPLKRHGKAYYYPTVKVKAITELNLITKWPVIDPTVDTKNKLSEALEKGDVKAIIKDLLFTIDNFDGGVLDAVIDQCQAYPMFNFDMMVPNTQYMSFTYGTMFDEGTNRRKLMDVEDNPDAKPGYVLKYHYVNNTELHLYLVRVNKATFNQMTDDPSYELHDLGVIYNDSIDV